MDHESTLKAAAHALSRAEALLIGAGAGMSADSGLATFRGASGERVVMVGGSPASYVGLSNPGRFNSEPEVAWGYYGDRMRAYREAEPHRGYRILRRWASEMAAGAFVLSSNVDGLFHKVGFGEERVLEGHGSVHYLQCTAPCSGRIWSADGLQIEVDEATLRARPPLPTSPSPPFESSANRPPSTVGGRSSASTRASPRGRPGPWRCPWARSRR